MADENQEIEFKKTSNKGPVLGILFIVAALAGYVFYTSNLAEEVSADKISLQEKNVELVSLQENVDALKNAEENLELDTEVKRLDVLKSIPTQLDQDEVIRDVIEISEENQIELKSISFGKGTSGREGIGTLRVNASFEGDYNDLINFLEGIEKNARVFDVDNISVQINELDIASLKRVNFSLSMQAFYQETN